MPPCKLERRIRRKARIRRYPPAQIEALVRNAVNRNKRQKKERRKQK